MDEQRRDALRDLAALLTALAFTLGPALGLFLVVFYTLGPLVLGPLDQPIGSPVWALGIFAVFVVLLCVGGFLGGTLWLVAADLGSGLAFCLKRQGLTPYSQVRELKLWNPR